MLWGGGTVVWGSLAIIERLEDKTGNEGFWPTEVAARGMARSMAAEMHSSFLALRREHSMNIRQIYAPQPPSAETMQEIERIMQLWAEARARFRGAGDLLFAEFGAADIILAPVVTRILT